MSKADEYTLLKPDEESKILELLSPAMRAGYLTAVEELQHTESPTDVFKTFEGDPYIQMLRNSFWREYDRCIALGVNIKPRNVYEGICSQATFNRTLKKKQYCLFIFTRPPSDESKLRYLLDQSYARLEEILRVPIMNEKGDPDHKIIKCLIETTKMIEERVKGSIVKYTKQEITSQNYNANATITAEVTPTDMNIEQLEAEISKQKLLISGKKDVVIEASK